MECVSARVCLPFYPFLALRLGRLAIMADTQSWTKWTSKELACLPLAGFSLLSSRAKRRPFYYCPPLSLFLSRSLTSDQHEIILIPSLLD